MYDKEADIIAPAKAEWRPELPTTSRDLAHRTRWRRHHQYGCGGSGTWAASIENNSSPAPLIPFDPPSIHLSWNRGLSPVVGWHECQTRLSRNWFWCLSLKKRITTWRIIRLSKKL